MDKKSLIMHKALQLFAQNGYHHTTIQHIADAAGIAKGGIYFYFKSKEELLLSVIRDYYDRQFKKVSDTAARYKSQPREGLVQQLIAQFEEISAHHSLLALFYRGEIDVNPELRKVWMVMRTKYLVWFRDQIIATYGSQIEPHAFDQSILLTSLVREYSFFILKGNGALSARALAEYIVSRLDNAVQGVLRSNSAPILTPALIQSVFPYKEVTEGSDTVRKLHDAAEALISALHSLPIPGHRLAAVRDAAQVIAEETAKPKPRRVILEGMLAWLKGRDGLADLPEIRAMESLITELT